MPTHPAGDMPALRNGILRAREAASEGIPVRVSLGATNSLAGYGSPLYARASFPCARRTPREARRRHRAGTTRDRQRLDVDREALKVTTPALDGMPACRAAGLLPAGPEALPANAGTADAAIRPATRLSAIHSTTLSTRHAAATPRSARLPT